MGGESTIIDFLAFVVPLYFAHKKKGSRGFWLLLACAAVGVIVVVTADAILTVPHYTFEDWQRSGWWELFVGLAIGSYIAAELRRSESKNSTAPKQPPEL